MIIWSDCSSFQAQLWVSSSLARVILAMEEEATQDRPDLTYFGTVPEAFVELADVLLVVEGSSFPAHSQYMAAHSNIMQQVPVDSEEEAWGLYQLADQFEAPGLMQRAIAIIEAGGSILKASTEDDGAVHYLQMAERLQLKAFRQRCLQFIAGHFESIQQDARIGQLQAATLVELLKTVQGLLTAKLEPRTTIDEGWGSGRYVSDMEDGECYHVKQQYWCHNACAGHALDWRITGRRYAGRGEATPNVSARSSYICGRAGVPKLSRMSGSRLNEIHQSRAALLKYLEEAF